MIETSCEREKSRERIRCYFIFPNKMTESALTLSPSLFSHPLKQRSRRRHEETANEINMTEEGKYLKDDYL